MAARHRVTAGRHLGAGNLVRLTQDFWVYDNPCPSGNCNEGPTCDNNDPDNCCDDILIGTGYGDIDNTKSAEDVLLAGGTAHTHQTNGGVDFDNFFGLGAINLLVPSHTQIKSENRKSHNDAAGDHAPVMNISHNLSYARYKKGMKVHDPMPNVTYKDMKKIIGLTPAMSMGDSSGFITSQQTKDNSGGIDFSFDNAKRTILEDTSPTTDPRRLSEFEQSGEIRPEFQSDSPFMDDGVLDHDTGDGSVDDVVTQQSTSANNCRSCCNQQGGQGTQLCGFRFIDPNCGGCSSSSTCSSSSNAFGCCPIPNPCDNFPCPAGCDCVTLIGPDDDPCLGGTPNCTNCPDPCDLCLCGCDANGDCPQPGGCGCDGEPVVCDPQKPCGGGCPPGNECTPDPGCGCGEDPPIDCECGNGCGDGSDCDPADCGECPDQCDADDCQIPDCNGVCGGKGCDGVISCCEDGETTCQPCPPCPDVNSLVITGSELTSLKGNYRGKDLVPIAYFNHNLNVGLVPGSANGSAVGPRDTIMSCFLELTIADVYGRIPVTGAAPYVKPLKLTVYKSNKTIDTSTVSCDLYSTGNDWTSDSGRNATDRNLTAVSSITIGEDVQQLDKIAFDLTSLARDAAKNNDGVMNFMIEASEWFDESTGLKAAPLTEQPAMLLQFYREGTHRPKVKTNVNQGLRPTTQRLNPAVLRRRAITAGL